MLRVSQLAPRSSEQQSHKHDYGIAVTLGDCLMLGRRDDSVLVRCASIASSSHFSTLRDVGRVISKAYHSVGHAVLRRYGIVRYLMDLTSFQVARLRLA